MENNENFPVVIAFMVFSIRQKIDTIILFSCSDKFEQQQIVLIIYFDNFCLIYYKLWQLIKGVLISIIIHYNERNG